MTDTSTPLSPSYPPVVYEGPAGEITATYRHATQPPQLSVPSMDIHYLGTSASTAGQYGMYRVEFRPVERSGARGPGLHYHRTMSESLYTVAGSIQMYDGDRWYDSRPGDFLFVPAGGLHAFRHVDDEPATMVMVFAPGAPREDFFEGMGAQMTPDAFASFAVAHDTFYLPGG